MNFKMPSSAFEGIRPRSLAKKFQPNLLEGKNTKIHLAEHIVICTDFANFFQALPV